MKTRTWIILAVVAALVGLIVYALYRLEGVGFAGLANLFDDTAKVYAKEAAQGSVFGASIGLTGGGA